MKRFILAIVLVLAFGANSWAINLRPYMQTPPEVQVFAKRVIEDGGQVVDLEFCQKYTRLAKQLLTWDSGKFVGDANMGVKLNSGVSVQTLYDLSGNNNDAVQATPANQPVWTAGVQNGRAGMVFDGTNDLLTRSTFGLSGSLSIIAVAMSNLTNDLESIVSDGGGATDGYTLDRTGVGQNTFKWWAYDGDWLGVASATVTSGVHFLVSATHDSANMNIYINSGAPNTQAQGGMIQSTTAMAIGRHAATDEARRYLNGDECHLSIFDTNLTTAQRQALENFCNAYYSIY